MGNKIRHALILIEAHFFAGFNALIGPKYIMGHFGDQI